MIRREMTVNLLPQGDVRLQPPSLNVTERVGVNEVRWTYRSARRFGSSPRQARCEVIAVHFVRWTVTR